MMLQSFSSLAFYFPFSPFFQRPAKRRSLPDWRKPISREQRASLIAFLNERVPYWRHQMNEEPVNWFLKNMKSQWGNCRPKTRRIVFNVQLVWVSDACKDYIIVHELSHLKHPNHSPAFKAYVSSFLSDWKSREQELKDYIKTILSCHLSC